MPINLQGSGPIVEGWGPPPQLHAPDISGLVRAILQNRLERDKMTQESIADTIKNVREERQSGEYLDAMKAAGLVPEDYDAGGAGGARYGTALAVAIERKRKEDERLRHQQFMEGLAGRRVGIAERRGRGGGGDESVQVEAPEDYYGLHNAPGAPSRQTTRVINGIVHVHDTHGGWKPGPKWMQQGTGQDGTAKPTDVGKAVKERLGLIDYKTEAEKRIATEKAANMKLGVETKDPKYKNVPFSESDRYNLTINRLKQLEEIPGMPSTAPQGTPLPAPADKNVAQGYGSDATAMSSDDVRAAYKAGKMTREEAQTRLKAMGFSD